MNINSINQQQNMYVEYSKEKPTSNDNARIEKSQDTVRISDAGKRLSMNKNYKSENTDRINRMLENARNDPSYAKTLARDLAYSDFLMSVDASTISEGKDIAETRYTNGDLVYQKSTMKSVQKWEIEADRYKEDNINLYHSEKANGTSDINIIMMIMEKNMNLPESFRKQQGNDYL